MERTLPDLGPRLMTVAAHVPAGGAVADIGTDHAYLPAWLVLRGRCERAIATDVSAAILEGAVRTVASYGLSDRIDLRVGDGLSAIDPGETSSIVVAGVGGLTMTSILSKGIAVARVQRRLVLQPMTHAESVRRWAAGNGMGIVGEDLAREGDRFYQVICLDPSVQSTGPPRGPALDDDIALELGPLLLREGHALLAPMIRGLLRECDVVIDRMRETLRRDDPRLRKWLERRDRLEEVLKCPLQ